MGYDYMIYFTKDGRYFGAWAFDSFTTMSRVIFPIMEQYPDIFESCLYKGHDDYSIIEVKVGEAEIGTLESLAIEYIDDVWNDFFSTLKEAMEMAIEKGCRVFLG